MVRNKGNLSEVSGNPHESKHSLYLLEVSLDLMKALLYTKFAAIKLNPSPKKRKEKKLIRKVLS